MQKTPTTAIPVSIGIPFDLLTQIDKIAQEQNISRSGYVVLALKEKLKRDSKQKA